MVRAADEYHRLLTRDKKEAPHYTEWEARSRYMAGQYKDARRILSRFYKKDYYRRKLPGDILRILYPLPREARVLIRQTAHARGVDPHLVAAVILQESEFEPAALSANMAAGYMQLTPGLFSRITAAGTDRPSQSDRFDPRVNVTVGSEYLHRLLIRFGNDTAKALAAYNAGEDRVAEWSRRYPNMPTEEWIEHIPFRQTRIYVKKILEFSRIYANLYPDFR